MIRQDSGEKNQEDKKRVEKVNPTRILSREAILSEP